MLKILFLIALLTTFSRAWALELDDVRILDISSNGKSATLDRGEFDNYKVHDYAKFYLQVGNKDFPKIFLVAEGELVKSFPKKSFWYFKNVTMPNLIYPESHLLILSTSIVSRGRQRNIQQRHVVYSDKEYNDVDQYLDQNKKGVPEKLILQEENFSNSGELFEKEQPREADLTIETYEKLSTKSSPEIITEYAEVVPEYYFLRNKKMSLTKILSDDDKKLLATMSKQYFEKNAKLKYGLTQGLYYNQENSGDKEVPAKKLTIRSAYDIEKENKKLREVIDPRFSAKIKRDGINWSDDMDDDTLRRYFITTGIAQEKFRRDRILNEREGHEVLIHYTGNMINHTTASDPNYRALGYNLGLSYDLHMARATDNLKNWSLQFTFEVGSNHYDLGGMNGTSSEVMYGAIANYYFINNPLSLNKFIFEMGAGVKSGRSKMNGNTLSQQYTYQMLSVPTLQLLCKYRFHIGDLNEDTIKVGTAFHAGLVYEQKQLSMLDIPLEEVSGTINVNDIKFQIGMGFYF